MPSSITGRLIGHGDNHKPMRAPLFWLVLWLVFFPLTLLIYSKALHAAPLYDDVAIPIYFQPVREFGWIDCFLPLDNGFIRPATMLSFKAVWNLVGPEPLLYHLVAASLHAAVAAMAAVTFCVVAGASRIAGAALGLSVTMASSAFSTVYLLSNNGDSVMALGVLLVFTSWTLYLRHGQVIYVVGTVLSILLTLMGKETGVAVAGVILLLTFIIAPRRKSGWLVAGAITIACAAYAVLMIYLQNKADISYANSNMATFDPVHMTQRILSFLPATVFPETFTMRPFWPATTELIWGVRTVAAILLILAAAALLIPRMPYLCRLAGVLYISAAGMLLPTSILTVPPAGRFLYSAIPLVMMAIGCVAMQLWPRRRWVLGVIVIAWCAWLGWQAVMVRKSPGAKEYYRASREYKNLVKELERLTPHWPPMQGVAFFTGYPYGSSFIAEPYGGAILRVYFPTLLAAYFSNRTPPETTRAYVFDGRRLTPVPAP